MSGHFILPHLGEMVSYMQAKHHNVREFIPFWGGGGGGVKQCITTFCGPLRGGQDIFMYLVELLIAPPTLL